MAGDAVEDGNSTLVFVDVDFGDEVDEGNGSMVLVDVDSELHPESFDLPVAEAVDNLVSNPPLRFLGYDQQGSHSSSIYQTPNGTSYGEMSCFGIRISGYKKWKGEITHRVLVCNKSGKPKSKIFNSLDPSSMVGTRGRPFKVTDCKALIRVKLIKGSNQYLLYEFSENHNHNLVSSDNMDLTRKGMHLNFAKVVTFVLLPWCKLAVYVFTMDCKKQYVVDPNELFGKTS
ncbi:hypothetical protein L1987_24017 [Smallanthus sonchifolius]|uniref:Uncharacterized protein n=1 Tax=Smallanthus sonchifolius TaxID=185202 RepID=A0ACB9IKR8_9ASTR|nr:hypothetical protein L1987_24017 [Smallanthus sonchifolius]